MGEGPFRSASLLKGANMVTAATRHLALGAKAEWAPHVCSHAEGAKLSTAKEKKARGGGGGGGGGLPAGGGGGGGGGGDVFTAAGLRLVRRGRKRPSRPGLFCAFVGARFLEAKGGSPAADPRARESRCWV